MRNVARRSFCRIYLLVLEPQPLHRFRPEGVFGALPRAEMVEERRVFGTYLGSLLKYSYVISPLRSLLEVVAEISPQIFRVFKSQHWASSRVKTIRFIIGFLGPLLNAL